MDGEKGRDGLISIPECMMANRESTVSRLGCAKFWLQDRLRAVSVLKGVLVIYRSDKLMTVTAR